MKNFQTFTANLTANYDKRRLEAIGDHKWYLTILSDEETKRPLLNITINVSDKPDDDITLSIDLEEFVDKLTRVIEYDSEVEQEDKNALPR